MEFRYSRGAHCRRADSGVWGCRKQRKTEIFIDFALCSVASRARVRIHQSSDKPGAWVPELLSA